MNNSSRIKEGIAKVVFLNKSYKWYRIDRRTWKSLIDYYRRIPDFYYAKIYNFKRGRKDTNGVVGSQIGYITLTKDSLNI